MITPPKSAATGSYTIVHTPTVEHRHGDYLGHDLPVRYQAIRDQLEQQHIILGQASHDAIRLSKPENDHLVWGNRNSQYLSAVAANAAMLASTLYQASVSLQHTAHLAGYDTSGLAPLSREIATLNEQIQHQYVTFAKTIAGHLSQQRE